MTTSHDLGWWYWAITVVLLGVGLFAWQAGIFPAMVLCVVQIIHVRSLTHDLTAFPVQVRVAYLAMLLAGSWGPLQWLHWVQLIGTSTRVVVGYCFLARALSLASWNRQQMFSWDLLVRTFCSPQSSVSSCGQVFEQFQLERVQG
ncbi:MAG: hypothetical protein A4E19_03875 [Nitrospira sp. SG-bin1]|nr:MAG: hypothetical protein A4E19_03875 [Nitrospira sp. SG-bin1]